MQDNRTLFELIKQNKTDEFIKYLKDNEDIDVNIRDNNNNYLINYAIILNNIEAITVLINRGSKLDIMDADNKSVLYIPIKYGFAKILELLLNFNKSNIGIPLTDMKDKNNNIPLHYAIKSNNVDAIKMLLDVDSDPNVTDNNGNNSLHMAVYTKQYDIVDILVKTDVNINSRTNTGETALHLACNFELEKISELLIKSGTDVNIQDNENEFTPLHYCINLNAKVLTTILIKSGADVNIQDFLGNTALHYAVIEENYDITIMLLSSDYTKNVINLNLYNIDNQLPIHILLSKIDDASDIKIPEKIMESIINNSNLNFQDKDGVIPLHYISKSPVDLWKKFTSILEKKKLNIFIRNKEDKRPIDYVNKADIDNYIDMVKKSYLYVLRNTNFTWKQTWENMCTSELFKDKLNSKDKKIIEEYISLDKVKSNEDICPKLVEKKLYDIYKDDVAKCDYISYPVKINKKCIDIKEGTTVDYCTFTGITLDILIGLIYLLNKHKNSCSTITTNFMENKELCSYYRSIGILTNTKCEFFNFEIVWVYHKLYFSDNFIDNFNKCIDNKKSKFIIVPLGIELRQGSHANYLIYDIKLNEIERFEPYGSHPPYNFDYNPTLLDNLLENQFKKIKKDIKYIRPKDYLPKIGFQYFDIYESKSKIADPGGFCALWAIWYADRRITYEDVPRNKLIRKLIKNIKAKNLSFKDLIRDYSHDILKMRDNIFNKAGITINNWLNEQYTKNNIIDVVKEIQNLISKIIAHY